MKVPSNDRFAISSHSGQNSIIGGRNLTAKKYARLCSPRMSSISTSKSFAPGRFVFDGVFRRLERARLVDIGSERECLRSGNLFFYNRGTWIQPESPNRGTDYKEARCNNEWRLPRSELNQDTKDNWRQGATKVSRHIHHAGYSAGDFAANIHGNCPGRPDRAFKKEHGSSQAIDGGGGILGQRGRHDKHRAAQHARDRHHPSRELDVAGFRQQPVSRQAANSIADDARYKR